MLGRKVFSVFAAFILFIAVASGISAVNAAASDKGKISSDKAHVESPLNLAILVQDDLVSRVGNELDVTRSFRNTAARIAPKVKSGVRPQASKIRRVKKRTWQRLSPALAAKPISP